MKKHILFLVCLLAVAAVKAEAAEDRWDNEGVQVSTLNFSSGTVVAFTGRGLVYGWGASSASVNATFDIFDSSRVIDYVLGASTNGRRIYRTSNYGVSQTSIAVNSAGDTWFQKPLRVYQGATWGFSDQTANSSRLYYYQDSGN